MKGMGSIKSSRTSVPKTMASYPPNAVDTDSSQASGLASRFQESMDVHRASV